MSAEPLTDEEMKLIRRSADHFYVPAEDLPRLVATIDRERERAERAEKSLAWHEAELKESQTMRFAHAAKVVELSLESKKRGDRQVENYNDLVTAISSWQTRAEQAEASCTTLRQYLALYAASDSLVAGVGDAGAALLKELETLRELEREVQDGNPARVKDALAKLTALRSKP